MSKINLLFFDHNKDNVDDYQRVISEKRWGSTEKTQLHSYFITSDVNELVKQYDINIIVSPANSLGFMDGGIDMVYMQMFPGIQDTVQARIKTFNITTALGRYTLPIGSAMLVPTGNNLCPLLACVPTMFLPEKITGTRNIYWAIRGLMWMLQDLMKSIRQSTEILVAIPCMGTGVGKLTAEESAHQVREALQDYAMGSESMFQPLPDGDGPTATRWRNPVTGELPHHAHVLTNIACPQINSYANTINLEGTDGTADAP